MSKCKIFNSLHYLVNRPLVELPELCYPIQPSLKEHREVFERLEDFAVLYRYPGVSADYDNAEVSLLAAESTRIVMRALLEVDDQA